MLTKKYAIIGAGISGIQAGKALGAEQVILIEKSKGVGGRVARRRIGDLHLDHGPLEPPGKLNEWLKARARDLPILRESRVKNLSFHDGRVFMQNSEGRNIAMAEKVIITAPAPQARELLENSGLSANFLGEVRYDSRIQFFILTKGPLTIPPFSFIRLQRTHPSTLGILSHLEVAPDSVPDIIALDKSLIESAFLKALAVPAHEIVDVHTHKWIYSEATKTISTEHQLSFRDRGIFLAGDYFSPGGMSASLASVENLLNHL